MSALKGSQLQASRFQKSPTKLVLSNRKKIQLYSIEIATLKVRKYDFISKVNHVCCLVSYVAWAAPC
jgi:hypothetical protein